MADEWRTVVYSAVTFYMAERTIISPPASFHCSSLHPPSPPDPPTLSFSSLYAAFSKSTLTTSTWPVMLACMRAVLPSCDE